MKLREVWFLCRALGRSSLIRSFDFMSADTYGVLFLVTLQVVILFVALFHIFLFFV
jgi:hypothetical protein